MTLPGSGDLAAMGFMNNTFRYNPLSQGVITTIDASVDKNNITNQPVNPNTTFTNTFRPLIEQDGLFYLAAIPGPTYHGGSSGYSTISRTGLVATDFAQFDFSTGMFGTAHPNFGGDPMLFGVGQITQVFVNNVRFEPDYDNLKYRSERLPTPVAQFCFCSAQSRRFSLCSERFGASKPAGNPETLRSLHCKQKATKKTKVSRH